MNRKNIAHVIFDLDGTLIDSSRDIMDGFTRACRLSGVALTTRLDKYMVGPPISGIVKKCFPGINRSVLRKIVSNFRYCYDNSKFPYTKLRPGIKGLLRFLAQNSITMAVVTNKPQKPSIKILKKTGILKFFSSVISPDAFRAVRLTKAQMIACVVKQARVAKAQTVVVGDAPSDITAAKKNNLLSIALLGGYAKKKELILAKPDFIFLKPSGLKVIINI